MRLIKRIWGMLHQIEEAEGLARHATDEAAELSARVQELEAWKAWAEPRLNQLLEQDK